MQMQMQMPQQLDAEQQQGQGQQQPKIHPKQMKCKVENYLILIKNLEQNEVQYKTETIMY
jgi:hypothetical protein